MSEGDFPLALPVANNINSGGYLLPVLKGNKWESTYSYSHIDLLVAGLEAYWLGVEVTNLSAFFDEHRVQYSCSKLYLAVKFDLEIKIKTIAEWKLVLVTQDNPELKQVLKKNAPLTFKWS